MTNLNCGPSLRAWAKRSVLTGALIAATCSSGGRAANQVPSLVTTEIVVYGGTSAGIVAAIQARRCGRQVILISPARHLGGLTTGGLGATDIGNKQAIGGISREFYARVGKYYQQPEAWKFQRQADYRSHRQKQNETEMWTFEPHVASRIFEQMLQAADVTQVLRGERLHEQAAVRKDGDRIVEILLQSGGRYAARCFIDATYEGDLMAAAGVSYTVGREANDVYGESLNGVQHAKAVHHQFQRAVDPYQVPGDPSSGLLFGIQTHPPGKDGQGDHRIQAYNFRMCLTDAPENRMPLAKPDRYDASHYELLARYFEAGFDKVPWHITAMPNRKTDINNNHGFSTDFIGANYSYPEASYAQRESIFRDHRDYQMGLLWFLASDPRVPEHVRDEVNRWGLCKDEFQASGGWPHELYVREARRLVGMRVMTQQHCQGQAVATQPIGMAAYTMDSHNTQRFVREGRVRNEGDVQVGGFPPYPIEYGAIVPQSGECANLLIPTCLSASHIAFGSIRMEPVFMVLGQSAATAAHHAIEQQRPVQEIDYDLLRQRLLADGQVLE